VSRDVLQVLGELGKDVAMKDRFGVTGVLVLGLILSCLALRDPIRASADAQPGTPEFSANLPLNGAQAGEGAEGTPLVTLTVEDALVSQILSAISRQTGRSIVIGPEITGRTTVRFNSVPWDQALESVLKPFGYGFYQDGDTTIVTGTNPLRSRVVTLKHLDASDVEPVISAILSPRGKIARVTNLGQSWGAGASQSEVLADGRSLGNRGRVAEDPKVTRSKTLVITDTPDVLKQVDSFLKSVDIPPVQILIEARFLELNPRVLRDVGFEFGSGGTFKDGKYGYAVDQVGSGVLPGNFDSASPNLSGSTPFNAGINLAFQRLSSSQYSILLHALQEDASANVLSAPRIMTLNNQEAVIVVGTKFPIINSAASAASAGGAATITTSLRGYEDIGIQLNVLPQVNEGNMINMIVRPSVRELVGTRSGKAVSADVTAMTDYPVISTREAETQVVLPDRETIVIGGLLKDRQTTSIVKVPLLGSIPWIGWLFRRETVQNEKVELLIFVTASIVPAEGSDLVRANVDSLAKRPSNLLSAPAIIANSADTALNRYVEPGLSAVSANAPLPSAPAGKK